MTHTHDREHRRSLRIEAIGRELAKADLEHLRGTVRQCRGRELCEMSDREILNLLNYLDHANQR